MDPKTNQTYFFNYINGQSQWEQPTAVPKQQTQPGQVAENAEGKATVDIKQEERQKEFTKGATAAAAKAVRVAANEAMRKAEKEAALKAKRAAALVSATEAHPAEAARHAANTASAASVLVCSADENVDDDEDDVFRAAADMVEAEAAAQPQLFREGAAHQESPVLHP